MGSKERILVALAKGHKTPKQLIASTGLAARTISFNLKSMCNGSDPIIAKYASIHDARQYIYYICNSSILSRLQRELNLSPTDTPPTNERSIEGLQSDA